MADWTHDFLKTMFSLGFPWLRIFINSVYGRGDVAKTIVLTWLFNDCWCRFWSLRQHHDRYKSHLTKTAPSWLHGVLLCFFAFVQKAQLVCIDRLTPSKAKSTRSAFTCRHRLAPSKAKPTHTDLHPAKQNRQTEGPFPSWDRVGVKGGRNFKRRKGHQISESFKGIWRSQTAATASDVAAAAAGAWSTPRRVS